MEGFFNVYTLAYLGFLCISHDGYVVHVESWVIDEGVGGRWRQVKSHAMKAKDKAYTSSGSYDAICSRREMLLAVSFFLWYK